MVCRQAVPDLIDEAPEHPLTSSTVRRRTEQDKMTVAPAPGADQLAKSTAGGTAAPPRRSRYWPTGWMLALRAWTERQRQRQALGEMALLNDHLFRDIGISPHEARGEVAKAPFGGIDLRPRQGGGAAGSRLEHENF
jgi:uncharacterized protein YjiS (DUF1127 family)